MNANQRILDLLERYTAGECSDEELTELFGYLHSDQYDDVFGQHILGKLTAPFVPGANLEAYQSEAIVRKIFSVPQANKAIIRKISLRQRVKKLIAAAAIVLVIVSACLFIAEYSSQSKQQPVVASLQKNSKKVINTTAKAIQLHLEDGSRITLQPSASLTYPASFTSSQREVLLEGDAFFDIARNPEKPFLVYHGSLVTRVLGTSFYIRYDNNQHEAEVEVTHGKVEVYENASLKKKPTKNNGVIITPNQKVVYTEGQHLFSTSLVDNPMPILNKEPVEEARAVANLYNFDKASLATIAGLLKESYGIEIELENDRLKTCLFTGDLSDQHLYSKLDIVCQAIGGSYEIKGTKILIKGKGCQDVR